jgi:LPS O-antigen subunit length determinant protein (WzzB/FepE family)
MRYNPSVHEFGLFLRLLAEKVYTARLATGARVLDAGDFKQWLQELADRANRAQTLEEFFSDL